MSTLYTLTEEMFSCKLIFIIFLAVIFIIFFGYPSYVKNRKNATVFTETKVTLDPNKSPAITILAWRGFLFNGWKNYAYWTSINSKDLCNASDTFATFVKCINDKTFKHSDIILRTTNGNNNMTNETSWTEEISLFHAGKSYSLNNIATQEGDDFNLLISLKSGQNYSIFIHDPNYYLLTTNPELIPKILLSMDDSKNQIVSIQATYQKKMDKPKQLSLHVSRTPSVKGLAADWNGMHGAPLIIQIVPQWIKYLSLKKNMLKFPI